MVTQVKDLENDQDLTKADLKTGGVLNQWLNEGAVEITQKELNEYMQNHSNPTIRPTTQNVTNTNMMTVDSPDTIMQNTYVTMVEPGEDTSVDLEDITATNCWSNAVVKFNGTNWACGTDLTAAGASITGTPGKIAVFSSPTDMTDSYLSQDAFGLIIEPGKNLTVNGLISGNGSNLTNLNGAQLTNGSIQGNALADGSIALAKLSQSGCNSNSTIKWGGLGWSCANDLTGPTYTAGTGLQLAGTEFVLNTTQTNTWTAPQSFNNGISVNGATLTNFAGAGLALSNGTLSSTLGASIQSSEIDNNAVTSAAIADNSITSSKLADGGINQDDIADGAITFTKLGNNGCAAQKVISWTGTNWACADDASGPAYSAGNGLNLTSGAFSLDTDAAHVWSGTQTFSAGLTIGGNTFTNLTGTGLTFLNGVLSSALGTTIETNELTDGSVTAAKLANNAITNAAIADNAVTFSKLGSNGCTAQQSIGWSGSAWTCTTNSPSSTYQAGAGLQLVGSEFQLDTSQANTWSGVQSFSNGVAIGGQTVSNLAGSGLTLSNGILSSNLGDLIQSNEIEDSAITFAKLGQNGCTNAQIFKWNGTAWACSADNVGTYTAGDGLSLTSGAFSLDTSHASTWDAVQTFTNGFVLGGNVYTNLAGNGLTLSGGTLASSLGTTVDGSEITNGTITNANIADGAITLAKLAQSSCTTNQTIKWNGSDWACATDLVGPSYTAGAGLTLSAGAFSLDTSSANVWGAVQTLTSGFSLGGNVYTNLAGTGLSFSGGTLSSILGTSIDSSEIVDATISAADIANGAVTSSAIASGAVATSNIATGAITSNLILDGTISSNDIADSAVTSAKILDGTVATIDLANNAVTTDKILDGTILSADIANGAITTANIVDGSITASKLSSSMRKRTATAAISSITLLGGTVEEAIFIPPTNGTITKVTFSTNVNVSALAGQGTMSVQRKTASAATVSSVNLASTSLTAFTSVSPTITGGAAFNAGDVYSFKYTAGTGLAISSVFVTIEYTANE